MTQVTLSEIQIHFLHIAINMQLEMDASIQTSNGDDEMIELYGYTSAELEHELESLKQQLSSHEHNNSIG